MGKNFDYYDFFITDNKSGHKTKKKWLEKNHPKLYSTIKSHNNNEPFKVKVWHFIHNEKNI